MPLAAMAFAWAITICASTVFEKLFHDDQPNGGSGTGICRADAGSAAANFGRSTIATHAAIKNVLFPFLFVPMTYTFRKIFFR
jgi:hypothetical protein